MISSTATAGIMLLIISWSFGICLMYYGYIFFKLKNEMIFIKRRGYIVTGYTVCSIIIQIIGYPLGVYLYWDIPSSPHPNSVAFAVLDVINDILYGPFYYFGAFLALFRYWMLHYDIHFTHCCLNLEWKKCINNDMELLKKEQWYIQNRHSLGNQSYLMRRVGIIGIIFSMLIITFQTLYSLRITNGNLNIFLNGLVFTIMVIMLITIWRKTPFFNDHIYLYKEFQIISYFWIGTLLIYVISICSLLIFGHYVILKFFSNFAPLFMNFIIPFLSTFWVLRHIQIYKDMDNLSIQMQQNERTLLRDILKDEDALNLFMQHLIDEFSMECLLAIIEFQQFKELATTELNVNITEIKTGSATNLVEITFPENISQSDIVYNNMSNENTVLSLKKKVYKLYNKYIRSGAEFSINISYPIKNKLDHYMTNYHQWISNDDCIDKLDLINIFEGATQEMIKLLNHSKGRFKYQKV